MKLFDLPQELAIQIVQTAELPPTQLIALGHHLTRSPNVISEAALDHSVWKGWSSAESLRGAHTTSLSDAFVQRWRHKTPDMKQELVRLYQRGYGPLNPRLPEDFDLALAACHAGLGRNVLGSVSSNLLQEPTIAAQLLADRTIFSDTLPHTFFMLQTACARFGIPAPKWSTGSALWKKFSPQSTLAQRATTPLYVSALHRWKNKPDYFKKIIESATETQRLKLFDFMVPFTGHDFDVELALHRNEGYLATVRDPAFTRCVWALNDKVQKRAQAPTAALTSSGEYGGLFLTADTEREMSELLSDGPTFIARYQAALPGRPLPTAWQ